MNHWGHACWLHTMDHHPGTVIYREARPIHGIHRESLG